jgi:Ras-related protein Rab-2A
MYYYETSAKTGQNVEKVFEQIAQRITVKIDKKIIDYT